MTFPILDQLEKKGVPSEVKMTARYYRHPQFPSRCLILEFNDGNPYLRLSKVAPEFNIFWGLDKNGVWKGQRVDAVTTEDIKVEYARQQSSHLTVAATPPVPFVFKNAYGYVPCDPSVLIDQFFVIEKQDPPAGAPPFMVMLEACQPIIDRLANRFKRERHYELNCDDLAAIARLKVHECWLYEGNKPLDEFQRIVSTSIWHKFESLLSKHYVTQSRSGPEVISITDDNIDMMPGEDDRHHMEQAELDELEERIVKIDAEIRRTDKDGKGLSEIERAIIREIHRPSPLIQQTFRIEVLRHNHLRRRGVRRLTAPRINILLMSKFTAYSEQDLRTAHSRLMQKLGVGQ